MIFTLGSFIRLRCKQTSPGYSSKTHTSPAVLHALLLTMAIITAFAYKLWLQMYLTENWNNQSTHGRKITTSETFASPATRDAVHGSTQRDKHDEELDDYSNAVTYVFHRVGSDGNIHPSTGVEVTLEQLCKMIQLDAQFLWTPLLLLQAIILLFKSRFHKSKTTMLISIIWLETCISCDLTILNTNRDNRKRMTLPRRVHLTGLSLSQSISSPIHVNPHTYSYSVHTVEQTILL